MVSFRFSIFNQKHCNKSYLDNGRYTWRHKYVLLAIAKSLSSLQHCTLFADPPSFASPSLITGDSLRPDLALISHDKTLYLLELTVGFGTNIFINSSRKSDKYNSLIKELNSKFSTVHFINLSMGALGILGTSSLTFPTMLDETGTDKAIQR